MLLENIRFFEGEEEPMMMFWLNLGLRVFMDAF